VINFYDIAWGSGVAILAPYWLTVPHARIKVLRALRERMGRKLPPAKGGPTVMIHAVSVGELNAARKMIQMLAEARPDLHFIISITTDTGTARGKELYDINPRVTLIRYPLDFTSAIHRVLDGLRPSLVVLMELEIWPNFVLQCQRRNIPVLLVNGRLTEGSYRHYRWGGAIVRRMFRRLSAICAQEQMYADRFIQLGAPPDRVQVTGTMKFDTAQVDQTPAGAAELAWEVGLAPGQEPIWVCGSTGPGEERIVLDVYRRLLTDQPRLRLVLVPRKPERFDEVAGLIGSAGFALIRRSNPAGLASSPSGPTIILGDTMGELRKFYSLADVVFVGRTLVDLGSRQHGSDMMEPAALAKPTLVGPFTGNFAEVMNQFRAADAIKEVRTPDELTASIRQLLSDPASAAVLGRAAAEVVRRGQGATASHVELIHAHLKGR
jgi:3-deoxy-D-manno-octulosonic-acid transferase